MDVKTKLKQPTENTGTQHDAIVAATVATTGALAGCRAQNPRVVIADVMYDL